MLTHPDRFNGPETVSGLVKLAAAAENVFSAGSSSQLDVMASLEESLSLPQKLQRIQQLTLPGTTVLTALRKLLIAFLLIESHHGSSAAGGKSHKGHKQSK